MRSRVIVMEGIDNVSPLTLTPAVAVKECLYGVRIERDVIDVVQKRKRRVWKDAMIAKDVRRDGHEFWGRRHDDAKREGGK